MIAVRGGVRTAPGRPHLRVGGADVKPKVVPT